VVTLETFTELRAFVNNPRYHEQRRRYLAKLDLSAIDAPIVDIVSLFSELRCCFTLQSCYGHFLHNGQQHPHNVESLPVSDTISSVEYRIAYIALCIEDSQPGRDLFHALGQMTAIDPDYVQFGCAGWFWKRQVNSYTLQVEPIRHKTKDCVCVDYREALHLEKIRKEFFAQIRELLQERLDYSFKP
jgi:hypothetical protein